MNYRERARREGQEDIERGDQGKNYENGDYFPTTSMMVHVKGERKEKQVNAAQV